MSRRRRPLERRRDRHKKCRSAEPVRWEKEDLLPAKPGWLDARTYEKLARLRETL